MKKDLLIIAFTLLAAGGIGAQQNIDLQSRISSWQNPQTKPFPEKALQREELIRATNMPVSLRADGAEALVFTIGDLTYSVTDEANQEATITGCTVTATAVTIPATVTYNGVEYSVTGIAELVFTNCPALTAIDVVPENARYSSQDGVLFNKDKTVLVQYPRAKAGNSYTIPNSVDSIGSRAFQQCSTLTQITIPENVTKIGEWVFAGSALTQVTIPSNVTSIGIGAFQECLELAEVTLNCSNIGAQMFALDSKLTTVNLQDGVTSIGDFAFYSCTGIQGIAIPNNVISIGNSAFYYCSALAEITFPENLASIGNYAFEGCHALTQVTIPNNVTHIGEGAFYACAMLETVTIGNGVSYMGFNAFAYCAALTEVNLSCPNIGQQAFSFCEKLATVNLLDGVESIGSYAFAYCPFTTISIPNSVRNIGYGAFYECNTLAQVTIGNGVEKIAQMAFLNTALLNDAGNWTDNVLYIGNYLIAANQEINGSYTVADGTRLIADGAFQNCSELTEVTIPASVIGMGESAFAACSNLVVLNVEATIPPVITNNTFNGVSKDIQLNVPAGSMDAYMADPNWQILFQIIDGRITGTCGNDLTWELVIGTGTLTISGTGSMFDFEINLPGWNPYSAYISTVSLPEGIENIGNLAFYQCSALTQINFPNSISRIGDWAFMGCSLLAEIELSNGITNIGQYAFSGCSSLKQINIPETVTEIGNGAFDACSALTEITIPGKVTDIRDGMFYGCSALEQITLHDEVTSIGDYAFYECKALKSIIIPDKVTSIGIMAFCNCQALEQITIGNNVTSIGQSAFYGCFAVRQIIIPENVASIGTQAFDGCTALTKVNWNAINCGEFINGGSITPLFFSISTNITEFTFGEQVEYIPIGLCYGMTKLTEITIPESIKNIGTQAFDGCIALTKVNWNAINCKETISGENLYPPFFNIAANITEFTFGEQVEYIPQALCYGMAKLTEITIPASVTSFGLQVLDNCPALAKVNWNAIHCAPIIAEDGFYPFFNDAEINITNFTFGGQVEYIPIGLCYGMTKLTQITIPGSVTEIGDYAFYNCSAISRMTVNPIVPPAVVASTFYNVSRNIPVYVPKGSLQDYQNAEIWKEFLLQTTPATALQTTALPESISVYGGMLHNPQGLPVSIYDMQGRRVYSGTATTVSQPAGAYVVRCAGTSSKMIF